MLVAGCSVNVDFGDGVFLCETDPVCPLGSTCSSDGVCVPDDDGGAVGELFRRAITISDTGDPTAAPLLVRLDPSRIDYASTQPDGSDVQFVDASGAVLRHEIERWEDGGESLIWVQIAQLSADRTVFLHYGGPSRAPTSTDLWQGFELVYHFGDVGDSAPQGYDAALENGAQIGDGRLGAGVTLDGIDDRVFAGTDLNVVRASTALSAALWVRPDAAGTTSASLLEVTAGSGLTTRMFISMQTTGAVRFGLREDDVDGPSVTVTTVDVLRLGDWNWVVVTADLSTQTMSIYLDGELAVSETGLALEAMSADVNASQVVIGQDDGAAMGGSFEGSLDELQILSRPIDVAWARAQHGAMTDELLTYGPAQVVE